MKKIKSKKINDVLRRAIKTFIQAFLGSLAVILPNTDISQTSMLKSVLIGAIASGISAVMNLINNLICKEE